MHWAKPFCRKPRAQCDLVWPTLVVSVPFLSQMRPVSARLGQQGCPDLLRLIISRTHAWDSLSHLVLALLASIGSDLCLPAEGRIMLVVEPESLIDTNSMREVGNWHLCILCNVPLISKLRVKTLQTVHVTFVWVLACANSLACACQEEVQNCSHPLKWVAAGALKADQSDSFPRRHCR